jgi:1-deoxy-D-xylulose-5-phosphate synthase
MEVKAMTDEERYPLLSTISKPSELQGLTRQQLHTLCSEIRLAILDNVSKTGGHFASNLGTVELAVAMYATYSIPPDKVVWDTGHQAYPHKMLSNRLSGFRKLRQYGGISGFLRMTESEYDHWGAGHACTAMSAALGYAVARDKNKTNEKVVAIVGDAAMTGGMCWEAMNNAAQLNTDICVVLNDNKMSIAENVGALTHHFAKLRTRPWFASAEITAKKVVEKLPKPIQRAAAGLRHGVTHYFAPEDTGAIFEELGFRYYGPIDGHNLDFLLDVFANIKEIKGPVFAHCITVKGKGYEVAEQDARKWHGVVPFDPDLCEMPKSSGPVSYTQAFGDTLLEIAKQDPKIIAITAAMPDGTGLTKFSKELPEQYVDVGIAEQHAVTFAAGLAAGGLKPACAIYSTFLQRSFDQIIHDVAIQNLPVRFFMDRAGLVGADGATHQGAFDISYLMMIPNMVIMAPRDTNELASMIKFAMNYNDSPIAVRYPRGNADSCLPEKHPPIHFGKAEALRKGDDVTLVGYGSTVAMCYRAAQLLEEKGIQACVLNVRFAKPLDVETIRKSVEKSRKMLIAEENVVPGGLGEAVMRAMREIDMNDITYKHLALPDRFIEHGTQRELLAEVGLTVEDIVSAVEELLHRKTTIPEPSKMQ